MNLWIIDLIISHFSDQTQPMGAAMRHEALCIFIPLHLHPPASSSLCIFIPLHLHPPASSSPCIFIPLHLHPSASSSPCIFIPLHLHPPASSSPCIFIPLHLHPSASSSLCIFIPLHLHPPASSSPCIFIPLHLHPPASSSPCIFIPLHLHPPASSSPCIFIPLHLHPPASSSLCIFIPLHLHPPASSSPCIFIPLHLHPPASSSPCIFIPLHLHPPASSSPCIFIPLHLHPPASSSPCIFIPLHLHPSASSSLCIFIPLHTALEGVIGQREAYGCNWIALCPLVDVDLQSGKREMVWWPTNPEWWITVESLSWSPVHNYWSLMCDSPHQHQAKTDFTEGGDWFKRIDQSVSVSLQQIQKISCKSVVLWSKHKDPTGNPLSRLHQMKAIHQPGTVWLFPLGHSRANKQQWNYRAPKYSSFQMAFLTAAEADVTLAALMREQRWALQVESAREVCVTHVNRHHLSGFFSKCAKVR